VFKKKQYFEVSSIERDVKYDSKGYYYTYTPVSSFLKATAECVDAYNSENKSKIRLSILEVIDNQHAHFALIAKKNVVEDFMTEILKSTDIAKYWAIKKIPRYMVSGE
jgi:hypothetical protein